MFFCSVVNMVTNFIQFPNEDSRLLLCDRLCLAMLLFWPVIWLLSFSCLGNFLIRFCFRIGDAKLTLLCFLKNIISFLEKCYFVLLMNPLGNINYTYLSCLMDGEYICIYNVLSIEDSVVSLPKIQCYSCQ